MYEVGFHDYWDWGIFEHVRSVKHVKHVKHVMNVKHVKHVMNVKHVQNVRNVQNVKTINKSSQQRARKRESKKPAPLQAPPNSKTPSKNRRRRYDKSSNAPKQGLP